MDTLLSYNWGVMLPEFIILGVATILCVTDLLMPSQVKRKPLGWIAVCGVLLALLVLIGLVPTETTSILYDTFRLDSFAKAFKFILLIGAFLVVLLAESYEPPEGMKDTKGEFYYLFLTALLGAMIMTSSGDLITMFVGLELMSISSYILTGIRKNHLPSNESAMKYVINGGISTAITLFGMSYLYGLTGTTNMKAMSAIMAQTLDGQHLYLYGIAFFMVIVGLSFKIAAAPFHMWAPDVYQGAPTPVTALLSVLSKTAGFIILLRIIIYLFMNAAGDEIGALGFIEKNRIFISVLAGITMIVGNVIALRQTNMKRLFAYSSIAHAGYLLVSIATLGYFTPSTVWFYLTSYAFMSIGVFAVIQFVADRKQSEEVEAFEGLYKQSPFISILMTIFLLSMAGIPGTAGFIAKLTIFMGTFAVDPSHFVLAAILIGTTVISYVYYFKVMSKMFGKSNIKHVQWQRMKMPVSLLFVLLICGAATIGLGIMPNAAFDFLYGHFGDFEDFLQ